MGKIISKHITIKPSINKKAYMREYGAMRNIIEKATMPWAVSYRLAKARCNNPNMDGYKYYGGKGIKFLLSKEEIKKIWIRDNACLMKSPTIDRIDNTGNYEFNNCRFLERSDNSGRSMEKRVAQYTKDKKLVNIYKSMVQASKATGVGVSNIMCAANVNYTKSKTAGGFIWVKI